MRLSLSLLATLLPLIISAAKKPASGDVFSTFHTQSLSNTPIALLDKSFDRLTSLPRNYTAVVLLTAIETRYGCQLCRDYQPEWELLAKSWIKGDKPGNSKVVFGTLDFTDGRQTFQALGLQTAPVLMLYPPTQGPDAKLDGEPLRMDFTSVPQNADTTRAWLVRSLSNSQPHPPINRPVNWGRIAIMTTGTLGAITVAAVAYPYLLPILSNRNLWAAISLIAILLFTSGHMFNQIRGTVYIAGDGKGGVSYFAGGFQNQYGLESQIVGAIYAVLAFATISLALKVPRMADPKSQQVAVIVWGAVMFGMYSFLLSVFRVKNGGYPFWLPPF